MSPMLIAALAAVCVCLALWVVWAESRAHRAERARDNTKWTDAKVLNALRESREEVARLEASLVMEKALREQAEGMARRLKAGRDKDMADVVRRGELFRAALENLVEAVESTPLGGDDKPAKEASAKTEPTHPHFCFNHGGCDECEAENAANGLTCPKCEAEKKVPAVPPAADHAATHTEANP